MIHKKKFWQGLPVIGSFFEGKPKIAVIRLNGVIADTSVKKEGICVSRYDRVIEKAFALSNLRAVALLINSPGGSPVQSDLMAQKIRQHADKEGISVYAFAEDVAASGGYWIACAADKIYAQPASIVGSIGVVFAGFAFDDFIKKHDIKRRVYTSGKEKSFMDPFLPEKTRDVQRLKRLQQGIHEQFKGWVRSRRKAKLKNKKDADIFEGQFWLGEEALECGIVDGLGDIDSVMKKKYGDDIKFVAFEPERGFLSSFLHAKAPVSLGGERDKAMITAFLAAADEQSEWARYGL